MTAESLATADFLFMSFRRIDVGMIPARVGRMTYTGDLGYELWVAPEHQRALFDLLWDAGQDGIALFGFRALMSLRMEKMFGTWMREYRPIYSPLEAWTATSSSTTTSSGAARSRRPSAARSARSSTSRSTPIPTNRPTYSATSRSGDGDVVGWVTSGAFAHYSDVSLAFGYVPAELAAPGVPGEQWGRLEVEIIGHRRPACLLTEPVLDPAGKRMRA